MAKDDSRSVGEFLNRIIDLLERVSIKFNKEQWINMGWLLLSIVVYAGVVIICLIFGHGYLPNPDHGSSWIVPVALLVLFTYMVPYKSYKKCNDVFDRVIWRVR